MSGPRIVDLGDMASARSLWTGLASQTGNPFGTWEWADVWLRHHPKVDRLVLAACQTEGHIVGLLPLYERRFGPFRLLRFIGHGPADRLGPLCRPEHRDLMAEALRDWLQGQPKGTVLLGDFLLEEAKWAARLGATTLARASTPRIDFSQGGWDAYLMDRSSNFRSQVRRRARRLGDNYRVEFRLTEDVDHLQPAFDQLLRLHELRWQGGDTGSFASTYLAFHREFTETALARGWLRLWTLYLDGVAAAAWYGIRFGDRDWYYQSGRDPTFDQDSVGFVLLAHTVRDAADHGQDAYELLRGAEPYKARFATSDPGLETVAIARGGAGRAAVRVGRALLQSPDRRRALAGFLRR